MVKHNVSESILLTVSTKILKINFKAIYEAASYVARYITFERQLLAGTMNDFQTYARVIFEHICYWNGHICEVSDLQSNSAKLYSC